MGIQIQSSCKDKDTLERMLEIQHSPAVRKLCERLDSDGLGYRIVMLEPKPLSTLNEAGIRNRNSGNQSWKQTAKKQIYFWSEAEWVVMHEEYLCSMMQQLGSAFGSKERADALQWIFEADLLENSKGEMVAAAEVPFSFKACCSLTGYDSDVLKDYVLKNHVHDFP